MDVFFFFSAVPAVIFCLLVTVAWSYQNVRAAADAERGTAAPAHRHTLSLCVRRGAGLKARVPTLRRLWPSRAAPLRPLRAGRLAVWVPCRARAEQRVNWVGIPRLPYFREPRSGLHAGAWQNFGPA